MSTPDPISRVVALSRDPAAALAGDAKLRRYRLARVRLAVQRDGLQRHRHLRRTYD